MKPDCTVKLTIGDPGARERPKVVIRGVHLVRGKNLPHWYGVALLAFYFPSLWLGWNLKSRRGADVARSGP